MSFAMEGALGRGSSRLVLTRPVAGIHHASVGLIRPGLGDNNKVAGVCSQSSADRLRGRPLRLSSHRSSSVRSRSEIPQIVAAEGTEDQRGIDAEAARLFESEFERASAESRLANGARPPSNGTLVASTAEASAQLPVENGAAGKEAGDKSKEDEEGEEKLDAIEDPETQSTPSTPVDSSASTSSFRWAQNVMSGLATRLLDLEKGLQHREQDMMDSTNYINSIKELSATQNQSTRLRKAEEMARRMQLQLKTMERTVEEKDEALNRLLKRTQVSEQRLEEVERQAVQDRATIMRELQSEKARSQVEIESVMKREEGLRMKLQEAQDGIAERDAFLKQLQEEAALSASALKQAAHAMVAARDRTLRIEEQLEMLGDQLVREKDNTAREKQKSALLSAELTEARMSIEELSARVAELEQENEVKERSLREASTRLETSGQELGVTAEALTSAEERIRELERILEESKEQLREEVQSSASALSSAAERERALQESEQRAKEMELEVKAIKEEVARKEKIMEAVREETAKNAELLTSAAKTRKELSDAKRRIEQMESEMRFLQEEVAEKESFLQDVRADARSSAEALRTATLIKQELNEAKERVGQLMDEIEARETEVQLLRAEIEENPKAQAAEMALQELTRRSTKLESERDALRSGIAKRDQALSLMKQELERGTHMLSAAAETREALREMKAQMDYLQHEAESKARRLSALEDEIVGVGQTTIPSEWLQPQEWQSWSDQPRGEGSDGKA